MKITTVQSASAPTSPTSPRIPLNLALGLVVGLLVGIGVAVLREVLDTRVHGQRELAEVTDLPVLAGITYDPDARDHPLAVMHDPHGPRAETFRQLRTNLQFVDVTNHPRSVVVTSAVPNEGKSTTAANLAVTLADAGLRTALVEADLRRPKVATYLGLESTVGLTTVLVGRASLDDALQPWGDTTLEVLTAGRIPPNPSELLGSPAMADLIKALERRCDMVVIDAPPLLPATDAAVLSRRTGGLLFVVGADKVTKPQIAKALESLAAVRSTVFGVVLNLLPRKGPDAYSAYTYRYRYEQDGPEKRGGSHAAGGSSQATRGDLPSQPAPTSEPSASASR